PSGSPSSPETPIGPIPRSYRPEFQADATGSRDSGPGRHLDFHRRAVGRGGVGLPVSVRRGDLLHGRFDLHHARAGRLVRPAHSIVVVPRRQLRGAVGGHIVAVNEVAVRRAVGVRAGHPYVEILVSIGRVGVGEIGGPLTLVAVVVPPVETSPCAGRAQARESPGLVALRDVVSATAGAVHGRITVTDRTSTGRAVGVFVGADAAGCVLVVGPIVAPILVVSAIDRADPRVGGRLDRPGGARPGRPVASGGVVAIARCSRVGVAGPVAVPVVEIAVGVGVSRGSSPGASKGVGSVLVRIGESAGTRRLPADPDRATGFHSVARNATDRSSGGLECRAGLVAYCGNGRPRHQGYEGYEQ